MADGEMDEKERQELFRFAEKAGLREKTVSPTLRAVWLKKRPDPALLEAWEHYYLGARQTSQRERAPAHKRRCHRRPRGRASGGEGSRVRQALAEERRVLERLEAAFG
jgi:hypothetical protein